MATPRKRRQNPTPPAPVEENLDEFVEEETTNFFEMLSEAEKIVEQPPAPVFRELSIIPSEDLGPRFVEAQPPAPQPQQKTKLNPPREVPQKRHPRNTPRFSRTK
jgi:hypothetical protein